MGWFDSLKPDTKVVHKDTRVDHDGNVRSDSFVIEPQDQGTNRHWHVFAKASPDGKSFKEGISYNVDPLKQ